MLLEAIHDADIVSRQPLPARLPPGRAAPQDRRRINQEITAELNARFGLQLTDAFCGFKAYRREALAKLHITETGLGHAVAAVGAGGAGRAAHQGGRRAAALPRSNRAFGGVLDDAEERLAHYRG